MGTASPDRDAGSGARARGAIELVGLVIAPTTLVTALAFYFGWVQTNARSSYFGIDASALGYSTQDYVLRSLNALFVPLGVLLLLALAAVVVHAFASRRLQDPRLRPAARVAVAAGALLFVFGVVAILRPLSFSPPYLLATASPAIGIALLAYGGHLLALTAPGGRARLPGPATALVVLVIVLSAFATVARYADVLGGERAADVDIDARPRVTVYAPKDLAITVPGVVDERLSADDGAYRHRYSGLRLLIRSDDKYFLLPEGWTRARGAAIVLADDPAYRFEFAAGGDRGAAGGGGVAAASTVLPEPVTALPPVEFEAAAGREQTQTVPVLADDDGQTLRGFSIRGKGASAFRVSSGTCRLGVRIAPGGDCDLRVTFAPRARGRRTAELVVDLEPGEDGHADLEGAGR